MTYTDTRILSARLQKGEFSLRADAYKEKTKAQEHLQLADELEQLADLLSNAHTELWKKEFWED